MFAKRAKRLGAGAALTILTALVVGCTQSQLKSTPMWSGDYMPRLEGKEAEAQYGPPEDRVNLWPLFYYRKPAFSALWPLVTGTEAGHAFIPLYEYWKDGPDLHFGTLHPNLISLASYKGEKNSFRLANIYGSDKRCGVFPLFDYNWKRQFLWFPPVVVCKKGDFFWSPLYTWAENFHGVLGPLFFVRKADDKRIAFFPFPFWGFSYSEKELTIEAFPLFSYAKIPAPEGVERTFLFLLGAYYYNSIPHETTHNFLWMLASHRYGKAGVMNYLFPLWFLDTGDRKSEFFSIPFIYHHNKKTGYRFVNALLLAYLGIDGEEGGVYRSVLFPFFHYRSTDENTCHTFLPLYHYNRTKDGVTNLLTPLFGFSGNGKMFYAGGPLYARTKGEEVTSHYFPWPLWACWSGEERGGSWLLPVYYYQRKKDAGHNFVSLLGMCMVDKKNDRRAHGVFPLYLHTKNGESREWITPIASYGKGKDQSFFNLLLALYHRSRIEDRRSNRFLLGFIGWLTEDKPKRFENWFLPLYSYRSMDKKAQLETLIVSHFWTTYTREEIDRAMAEYVKRGAMYRAAHGMKDSPGVVPGPDRYRHTWIMYLAHFRKWYESRYRTLETGAEVPDGARAEALSTTRTIAITTDQRRMGWFFPLFYYDSTEGKEAHFNIMWRLFDVTRETRDDGAVYRRHRVLWRLFHREALRDRVSMDVFPFFACDKGKDLRKVSFAAGLVGWGRKGDRKHVKVFWIPFRWKAK